MAEKWCLWVREQCTDALFVVEKSTKPALEKKKKKKKKLKTYKGWKHERGHAIQTAHKLTIVPKV